MHARPNVAWRKGIISLDAIEKMRVHKTCAHVFRGLQVTINIQGGVSNPVLSSTLWLPRPRVTYHLD